MKAIRNTVIIFTLLMLISLIAFIVISNGIRITGDISTSYASEDLSGYSMALDRLRDIFYSGRDRLFKAVMIFWGAVLVSGYLFIFLVYRQLVKPVREMENFASEIAKGNLECFITEILDIETYLDDDVNVGAPETWYYNTKGE